MAQLFIFNVTPQKQEVCYRMDFSKDGLRDMADAMRSFRKLIVESGRQAPIPGDLHPAQAQSIMDQLAPVGGVGTEELNRLPRVRIAYIMSLGRPVTRREVEKVQQHNTGVLTTEGQEIRKRAAIASNDMVAKAVAANQEENARLTGFEMSVEEGPAEPGMEPAIPHKPVAEGYRIGDPAEAPSPPRPAVRGRRG